MDPAAHPDLPAALRWLRHRGHLTQREAAGAAGVSLAYYKQLELGHRRPAPETLGRLARGLGSDAGELAGLLAHQPWAGQPVVADGPRITRRTPKPAAYRDAARRALADRAGAWSDPVAPAGGAPAPAPAPAPPPPALAGEVAELVDHYVHLSRADQRALLGEARRRRAP